MQFIDDWMTCAGISALTDYEEALIGTPGPDGEDPLRNWKPIGLLAAMETGEDV